MGMVGGVVMVCGGVVIVRWPGRSRVRATV